MAEPATGSEAPKRRAAVHEPAATSGDGERPDAGPSDVTSDERAPASHEQATCPVAWCPICLAVTTVQPLRPDVVEHLLKAGTEMMLAFRAVIEARADDLDPASKDPRDQGGEGSLEKIDLG